MSLTRDEILAMPPGREMDYLVAQAMGWKLNRGATWWTTEDAERVLMLARATESDEPYHSQPAWSPSTESADAAVVIEHFRMTVTPKTDATDKSRWLADVELKGPGQLYLAFGPTLALAVCRCALLATTREEHNNADDLHR